ncbi:hypothetical protein [Hymenobacter algoricola]|uniref:YcxB family protein n=1 Tax=Hymenobacter algoricola TaxID=486267 RepID=A0ABP7MGU2_9BACT
MDKGNYTIQAFRPVVSLGVLLGGTLLFAGSIWLLPYGLHNSKVFLVAWGLIWLALGCFLIRKLAVKPVFMLLNADSLSIQASGSPSKQQIKLDQVASYLYEDFSNNQRFRLRLQSGEKVVLRHNDVLCPDDDIQALAREFERLVGQQNFGAEVGAGWPIRREKTFFEKPAATVVLVVFSVAVAFILWSIIHDGRPVRGGLFTAIGGYVAYLAAWWAAAGRRNQQSE